MKKYATLNTHDIHNPFNSLNVRHGDYSEDPGTLDDFVNRGWRVIASTIQVDHCGRNSTYYLFVLEKEVP